MSSFSLIHSEDFHPIVKNNDWVVIDFWAEWCGPCKAMSPVFDSVTEQRGDALTGIKVDVDQHQQLASDYSVRSIPTLVLLKNGEVVDTRTGAQSEKAFNDWLDQHITNS